MASTEQVPPTEDDGSAQLSNVDTSVAQARQSMESIIVKLCDDAGEVCSETRLKLDGQMSSHKLEAELCKCFGVPTVHQEIFHNEERIDLQLELNMANFKAGLILKHGHLSQWALFKKYYDRLKKMKPRAIDRNHLLMPMIISKFLENYAHFFDNKHIEYAARAYFQTIYSVHGNVEIKTESKANPGAQGGIMCEVNHNDNMLAKFHVKCQYGTNSYHSSEHSKVDLRELFAYKLLEIIKVGPVVHFVRNVHRSTYGVYIATQDVEGFEENGIAKVDDPGKLDVQLQLLAHIFQLSDLSESNYGINSQQELVIVDFKIKGITLAEMKNYIKYFAKPKYFAELKECMERWDFQEAVKKAHEEIIAQQAFMKKDQIYNKLTKDYTTYIEDIKGRISWVVKHLEVEGSSTSEAQGSSAKKPKMT